MAGESNTILVADAHVDSETGEVLVEVTEHQDGAEVAVDADAAKANGDDTHATTEAHGGDGDHSDVFPPFDPATFGTQLIWLAITFGALYLLMSKIALPRIGEILETRRDRIEGDLAEADRFRQKTDQAIEAYELALSDARKKAHGIAEETREKINGELDGKRHDMEDELSGRIATAEARIHSMKTDALANVDEIAAETAVALVMQVSGKVSIKSARDAVAQAIKE